MLPTQPSLLRCGAGSWCGAKNEGLNYRSYYTLRSKTVGRLYQMLQSHGCVLIRAPACAGKTSLLQLVYSHAQEQGVAACYLQCATLVSTPGFRLNEELTSRFGGTLAEMMQREACPGHCCMLGLGDLRVLACNLLALLHLCAVVIACSCKLSHQWPAIAHLYTACLEPQRRPTSIAAAVDACVQVLMARRCCWPWTRSRIFTTPTRAAAPASGSRSRTC